MTPQKNIHVLTPRNYECYLVWQRDVVKLRVLRWGDYPVLSR